MVRPSDSRGRDRTRSIQLDGRVSEIAQNLASQGKLSSVISDLLYEKYGHTSKRAKLEAKLAELDAETAEIELRKGQVKKALELHENNQKRNSHKIDELEIQLESMIKSLRETEAMIQTGHKVNAGGISYQKVKRNQSELVEKFRRQLEELK